MSIYFGVAGESILIVKINSVKTSSGIFLSLLTPISIRCDKDLLQKNLREISNRSLKTERNCPKVEAKSQGSQWIVMLT